MAAIGNKEVERKVMVAIDESEYSHYALMWALDNLKESITEAQFFIFMAQPLPKNSLNYAGQLGAARMFFPVSSTPDYVNSIQEKNRKLSLAFLEKAKEICNSRGVHAEIITEVGDPETVICNVVNKLNITMLVMGERGLGRIKRAILGSVSNYCLQNAKCPVLIVRKP